MSHSIRIFCPALAQQPGTFTLDETTFHHVKALRIEKNEPFYLFDGQGQEHKVILTEITSAGAKCSWDGEKIVSPPRPEISSAKITLIQSLPKADTLDSLVRMTTELGVETIHLVLSERSVPKPESARWPHRQKRLSNIAAEAAAVSGRSKLPTIHSPKPLLEVAQMAPQTALRLVCWEESAASQTPWPATPQGSEAWMVVGPEGGLSANEIASLRALGFVPVSLGPWILRVDTAATSAVALIAQLSRVGAVS